jgi:hypothetical protein
MEDVGIPILCPFGVLYGHLQYFMAIWYIFWLFGVFCPVLVCWSKKNLATLLAKKNRGLKKVLQCSKTKLMFSHL